jgi:hypothetical protein
MCGQVRFIRWLPFRPIEKVEDEVYNHLRALGADAIPCLIQRIKDAEPMRDPRQAPKWGDVRVGDTAFFVLGDMGIPLDLILESVFSSADKERHKEVGIYAYFEWIAKGKNRRAQLQDAVRRWYDGNPDCCQTRLGETSKKAEPDFQMDDAGLHRLRKKLAAVRFGQRRGRVVSIVGSPASVAEYDSVAEVGRVKTLTYIVRKWDRGKDDLLLDRYVKLFFLNDGGLFGIFSSVPGIPSRFKP